MDFDGTIDTYTFFADQENTRRTGVFDREYCLCSRVSVRPFKNAGNKRYLVRNGSGPYRSRVILVGCETAKLIRLCSEKQTVEDLYNSIHGEDRRFEFRSLLKLLRALDLLEFNGIVYHKRLEART